MRSYHERMEGFAFFIVLAAIAFAVCSALLCMAFADEISVQYLVYRPSFTPVQLTSLRRFGLYDQSQPAMNTRFELAKNATAYAVISLSTASLAEDSAVQTFVNEGRMQRIGAIVIKRCYDSRT